MIVMIMVMKVVMRRRRRRREIVVVAIMFLETMSIIVTVMTEVMKAKRLNMVVVTETVLRLWF